MKFKLIRIGALLTVAILLFVWNLQHSRPIEIWLPLAKLVVGSVIVVPICKKLKIL